jgi:hypothetical protein
MAMTQPRILPSTDPVAVALTSAIHTGDVAALRQLLDGDRTLAHARIGEAKAARSLIHLATDWPGHFPNVAETIAVLAASGADVNARMPPNPNDPNCM